MTSETPAWMDEFGPEFDVPTIVTNDPELADLSWGNDVCPSFTVRALADTREWEETGLRLWIDHPNPDERETGPESPRFRLIDDEDATDDYEQSFETIETAIAELKRRAVIRLKELQGNAS